VDIVALMVATPAQGEQALFGPAELLSRWPRHTGNRVQHGGAKSVREWPTA